MELTTPDWPEPFSCWAEEQKGALYVSVAVMMVAAGAAPTSATGAATTTGTAASATTPRAAARTPGRHDDHGDGVQRECAGLASHDRYVIS
jgi:hypothetical protein